MHSEANVDMAEAAQAMRARLVRFILPDSGEVDARTVTILNRNRIFKTDRRVTFEDLDFSALFRDASEQAHMPLGPQVMRLRVDDHGNKSGDIISITDLLLDCRVDQRSLALDYVQKLAAQTLLAPRSAAIVEKLAGIVAGRSPGDWQKAVISVVDALEDDFLLNLAGLRQSLSIRFTNGLDLYLPRVLRPPVTSFESMQPPVWGPTDSEAELKDIIIRYAAEDELTAALQSYWRACGHLPLGSAYAASAMVSIWIDAHETSDDCWQAVWRWGQDAGSPIAMYHVAELGITLFEILEPDEAQLRQAIWSVVQGAVIRKPEESDPAWMIRYRLATHYCRHIETCVPNQAGDRIPSFSWWIADKVSSVFGSDDGALRYGLQQCESTMETTKLVWAFGVRTGSEAAIRYATLFSSSMWADSLLAILWRSRDVLSKLEESELEFSLGLRMIFAFPQPSDQVGTNFAFEEGLNRTVEAWLEIHEDSSTPDRLGGAFQTYLKLSSPKDIGEALPKFDKYDGTTQLVLANALRVLAFQGTAPRDVMWGSFSSEDWRQRVFQECSLDVLEALLHSARHLQFVGGDDWRTATPHFFAQECLRAHDTQERRSALLLMTVVSSIAADAVSAVQRIVTSEHRAQLEEDLQYLREQLVAVHRVAPPWLAGRIRAVLSVL